MSYLPTHGPAHPPATTQRALAMPIGLVVLVCWGLAACSSGPPVPEWQVQTSSASERATQAYLSGYTAVADSDWQRATQAAARSALPAQVARVKLRQCAAQVASLVFTPCAGLDALVPDMGPDLLAYQRYLSGQWSAADVALLPAAQQPVARLPQPGTGSSTVAAGAATGSAAAAAAQASTLQGVADPLSRLLGAAVLLRAGQAHPPTVALAVDTASAQGWARPALAWLGVQAQMAEQAGDTATAQRARRRMDLLAPVQSPRSSPSANGKLTMPSSVDSVTNPATYAPL